MIPLRIAVVGHIRHPIAEPFMGGMEAYTWNLARTLAARGHDVTLFASGDSRQGCPEGVTLHPVIDAHYDSTYPWHEFHGTETLTRVLDTAYGHAATALLTGNFDVIHNNSLHRYIPRLASQGPVPMVTSLHIPPFKALKDAVEGGSCPWHIQTVTSERQKHIWWPQAAPASAKVVHNGIDPALWPFAPTGDGSAVWSGRITPTKGTHLAAQAARLAGIPLKICGAIEHKDYFDTQVRPHLDKGVSYLGLLSARDLAAQYRRSSALLFTPLWEEPFGLAAVEAMATGLPVAATGHGAVREVIGDAGVIARSDAPEDLARALLDCLTIPAQVPRDRVLRLFTLDHMIGELEDHYTAAIARLDRQPRASFQAGQTRQSEPA